MRCDQHFGLCPEAVAFLEEHEVKPEICSGCNRAFPRNLQILGHYYGMFNDEYPLNRHVLEDGRYADEYVQANPWSSGPCFFIGLKLSTGEKFEWSKEAIENA